MPLTSGTRLGPYQIESALGAGGMGEVYKARDTRLDRAVAIKVLPSALAADAEFRERFDREARAISQLNHPNICTLHDVGEAVVSHQSSVASPQSPDTSPQPPDTSPQPPDTGGVTVQFLVMELLDGETLASRLSRSGPKRPALQVAEALAIAIQIGEALAAAHRAGLTHRDLKPGNVMLTKTGAKLLDFGLAKAGPTRVGPYGRVGAERAPPEFAPPMTAMPTTPAAMTAQGAIVGTFQYMAPEQVEGHDADARSDIFAFGCVLYEMLAGRKAFEGKSHASLIGAIMHAEPQPISGIVPAMSPALDRIVRKCLAKDPDARWQSARDLVDELKWIADGGAQTASPSTASPVPAVAPSRLPWALFGVAALAAVALGVALLTRAPVAPSAGQTRFTIPMPDGWDLTGSPGEIAVSPDGTRVIFAAANHGDARQLWMRPLDATEASPIPHTEGAEWAFWAPDGKWIGYYCSLTKQLKKTDASGGQSQVICDFTSPLGATWSADGVIVFGSSMGLYRVTASGGPPVALTKVSTGEGTHAVPTFFPDGRQLLFSVFASGLFVGSVDGPARHELVHGIGNAFRLVGDELLAIRGSALVSQHFDTRRLTLTGEPTTVVAGGANVFAASSSVLVYQPRRDGGVHELAWFDRAGRSVGTLGDRADYSNLEFSPDGAHLATAVLDSRTRTRDIWIYELSRGIRQRFTFSAGDERTAVWSPDGKRILFNSREKGLPIDFYQKAADGSGPDEPVLVDGISKDPLSWSPDGRHLLYRATGEATNNDLWVLPAFGDRKPFPFAVTPFDEQDGRISPDGRWVAYSTDESGQMEVYVARFPSGGGKSRISAAGGSHPRWRRDGKELFYLSIADKMMAVDITSAAEDVRVGAAHALFAIHPPAQPGYSYDVTADGQRFLVNTDVGAIPALTVVTNWKSAK